jgi:hypothetical protein
MQLHRIAEANLAGVSISHRHLDGMTIDGVPFEALLAAYQAQDKNKV